MQAAFLVQIAYAIFTWLLAGLVIEYQGYNFIASGIKLKSGLLDYYIFFLVFLFGVRNAEDGLKVIKWILVGAIFANLCHHSRHRRHRQSRLQGAHRRPHPGRDGRIQPVCRVHRSVHSGNDRGRGGQSRLHAARVAGWRVVVMLRPGDDGFARRHRRRAAGLRDRRLPVSPPGVVQPRGRLDAGIAGWYSSSSSASRSTAACCPNASSGRRPTSTSPRPPPAAARSGPTCS